MGRDSVEPISERSEANGVSIPNLYPEMLAVLAPARPADRARQSLAPPGQRCHAASPIENRHSQIEVHSAPCPAGCLLDQLPVPQFHRPAHALGEFGAVGDDDEGDAFLAVQLDQ